MSYVIVSNTTGKFAQTKGSWTLRYSDAHKFKNIERAENYLSNNFIYDYKNDKPTDVRILCTSNLICDKEGILLDFSDEMASSLLSEMKVFYRTVIQKTEEFYGLVNYYGRILEEADLETLDLLHKIEMINQDVFNGYKTYKQLQDVRKKRRVAKDGLEISGLLVTSGLSNALKTIKEQIEAIENQNANRTYVPRVIDELFDN